MSILQAPLPPVGTILYLFGRTKYRCILPGVFRRVSRLPIGPARITLEWQVRRFEKLPPTSILAIRWGYWVIDIYAPNNFPENDPKKLFEGVPAIVNETNDAYWMHGPSNIWLDEHDFDSSPMSTYDWCKELPVMPFGLILAKSVVMNTWPDAIDKYALQQMG